MSETTLRALDETKIGDFGARKIVGLWLLISLPAGAAGHFQLTSPSIQPGGPLPVEFTAQGANVSPPLAWSDPPPGTAGYVLLCTDTDAPFGTFTHWVCANIPASTHQLPRSAGLGRIYIQGKNDFRKIGYSGPDPPKGKPHHYHFLLVAVASQPKLSRHPTRAEVTKAIGTITLGQAELIAVYAR